MKIIITLSLFILLTNCAAHNVKIGKRCTTVDTDGGFEKSFIWFVDKSTAKTFDKRINKENCKKNG